MPVISATMIDGNRGQRMKVCLLVLYDTWRGGRGGSEQNKTMKDKKGTEENISMCLVLI